MCAEVDLVVQADDEARVEGAEGAREGTGIERSIRGVGDSTYYREVD